MTARSIAIVLAVAGAGLCSPALADQKLSTSLIRPTLLEAGNGVVAGPLPGGTGAKSYYVATDLETGELRTQIKVTAPSDDVRSITFELLDSDAAVKDSYYVKTMSNQQGEQTRTFAIDNARRYNLRVTVDGPETGSFCVLLGGSALPKVASPVCPAGETQAAAPPPAATPAAPTAEAPPPPPAPQAVEVITTKCEQRLRVGSEVLFDFDKATLRPEARPAMDYIAMVIEAQQKPLSIEGHTDSKGTDSYNDRLSQQRAQTVEVELRRRIRSMPPTNSNGYGESRPVAPNEFPDGSDNPEGRRHNRRVDIVINTCT
jgi:outer membrane protein OmpA-like peptidoglycan-associated protein